MPLKLSLLRYVRGITIALPVPSVPFYSPSSMIFLFVPSLCLCSHAGYCNWGRTWTPSSHSEPPLTRSRGDKGFLRPEDPTGAFYLRPACFQRWWETQGHAKRDAWLPPYHTDWEGVTLGLEQTSFFSFLFLSLSSGTGSPGVSHTNPTVDLTRVTYSLEFLLHLPIFGKLKGEKRSGICRGIPEIWGTEISLLLSCCQSALWEGANSQCCWSWFQAATQSSLPAHTAFLSDGIRAVPNVIFCCSHIFEQSFERLLCFILCSNIYSSFKLKRMLLLGFMIIT